ncbi:hypothetical protein QMO56_14650 [Roseomonas sp. E05]|uniref:hypothetical protein n=1 Tax=Roseomonas sp. E05 TaxID=3046310 RepID=UPI0024BA28BD|nr:hypothetical protein [Roseomonas sp. E05]MDJ0389357.1 hypothetical protein [Roseomonas sp. E05]
MQVSSNTPTGLVDAAYAAAQGMRTAEFQLADAAAAIARRAAVPDSPPPDPARRPFAISAPDLSPAREDVAPELTMIEAQHAYESNLAVQRTVGQMADHTLDILR